MSLPITGFTAIPNPQMLAFMPIQSYLMMYFAGAGWQIGKRKISAIPNDEFNKMSANDLLKGFTADLRETIPTLQSSMQDITPLVNILVKQYGDFAREIINVIPQVAQGVAGSLVNPKGALVPPLFGPELEKLVTGNASQAQFLAYAKILLRQEADRQSNTNLDSTKFQPPAFSPPSTKPGFTVAQAQAQAIATQTAFEKQKEDERLKAIQGKVAFLKIPQPTPQVIVKFKAAAGQSQRLEREKLIKALSAQATLIKAGGVAGSTMAIYIKRFRNTQQQLVNLLERYRF